MRGVVGTDKRISLFEIAKKEDGARLSVDSEGEVDGPSWPNGTHICEVEIDPETGVSKVVRYTTVDDVGIAVNPMLVTGQVHGGGVHAAEDFRSANHGGEFEQICPA